MAPLWEDHDLAARARTSRRRRLLGENAECADCKESDPLVLKRDDNGEILCLNCRALRDASKKANIWALSLRSCTSCGFTAPLDREDRGLFERHHTVGRANLADHTTWLCKNCHAKVTATQRAFGVDLGAQPNQHERCLQSLYSSLCEVGVAVTCTLESNPTNWWQGFERTLSALADAAEAVLRVMYIVPPPGEP